MCDSSVIPVSNKLWDNYSQSPETITNKVLFVSVSMLRVRSRSEIYVAQIGFSFDTFSNVLTEFFGCIPTWEEFLQRVNEENDQGHTILTYDIEAHRGRHASDIIFYGANVNHRNKNGTTPLGAAIDIANAEIVETLCEAGANVDTHHRHLYPLELMDWGSLGIAERGRKRDILIAYGCKFPLKRISTRIPYDHIMSLELACKGACTAIIGKRVIAGSKDCSFLVAKLVWRTRRRDVWKK